MSNSDLAFEHIDSLSIQELEAAVFRINERVRRCNFKEATYRRLLINKIKKTHSDNMMMSTQQARSLTSNRGKKLGGARDKNKDVMYQ